MFGRGTSSASLLGFRKRPKRLCITIFKDQLIFQLCKMAVDLETRYALFVDRRYRVVVDVILFVCFSFLVTFLFW